MDPGSSAAAAATAPQVGSKRTYQQSQQRATDNKLRSKLSAQAQDSTATGSSGSGRVSTNRSTTSTSTSAAVDNFVTQGVIDATIQCMIAQADECEMNGLSAYQTERMIMAEMGRCLVEIIEFSVRHADTSQE